MGNYYKHENTHNNINNEQCIFDVCNFKFTNIIVPTYILGM